jgi:membrane protein
MGRSVQGYLANSLPRVDILALRDARGAIGVVAFVGLPISGWLSVDAFTLVDPQDLATARVPGSFFVRLFFDLVVLAGLGVLLAVSLSVAFVANRLANRLVSAAGTDATPAWWLLAAVGLVLGVGVNTLLSIAVLTGPPRLRMPLRRVLGPGLLVAAGLELLKTLGRLYVQHTEANPTYQLVTGAVGLLVFLSVVNQLLLFAATLTATSTAGQVTDLAVRSKPDPGPTMAGLTR